jgi:hypothetical protein
MATGLEQQLIKGARFAAGPVVPIGSIAAAGFEKGEKKVKAEQQAKQQADFEERKLEAEDYKNRLKSQDKILDNLFKNRTKAKVNADLLKGYWGEANIKDSEAIKLSEAEIKDLVKSGKISNSEALTMQREQVNDRMGLAVQRADNYSAFAEVVDNIRGAGVSSSVPSESIDEVNAILLGDSKAITAISKKYDIPPEDLLSEDALEKIGFKAADSGAFENVFSTVITAADNAASRGKSLENYKQDIQTAVSSMKLSDEQVQSVAFDYLGKQLPEYTEQYKTHLDAKDTEGLIKAVGDLNADGEASEEDLRIFITNQMVEAGEAAYEGYKKDYADKFETGTSKDGKGAPKGDPVTRAGNIYNMLKKDPKSIIDQVFANAEYEIINNKVQFFKTDKDTKERLEAESYDLKSPSGIKGLASSLSQAYYGEGTKEDLILDQFDLLVDKDPDFNFQSIIFPEITTGNLPTN